MISCFGEQILLLSHGKTSYHICENAVCLSYFLVLHLLHQQLQRLIELRHLTLLHHQHLVSIRDCRLQSMRYHDHCHVVLPSHLEQISKHCVLRVIVNLSSRLVQ